MKTSMAEAPLQIRQSKTMRNSIDHGRSRESALGGKGGRRNAAERPSMILNSKNMQKKDKTVVVESPTGSECGGNSRKSPFKVHNVNQKQSSGIRVHEAGTSKTRVHISPRRAVEEGGGPSIHDSFLDKPQKPGSDGSYNESKGTRSPKLQCRDSIQGNSPPRTLRTYKTMLEKSPTYDRRVLEQLIFKKYKNDNQASPEIRQKSTTGWPMVVNLAAQEGFQSAKLVEAASYGGIGSLPKPPKIDLCSPSIPFLPLKEDSVDQVVDVKAIANDVRNLLIEQVGKKNFNRHLRKQSKVQEALHTAIDARNISAAPDHDCASVFGTSKCSYKEFYNMDDLLREIRVEQQNQRLEQKQIKQCVGKLKEVKRRRQAQRDFTQIFGTPNYSDRLGAMRLPKEDHPVIFDPEAAVRRGRRSSAANLSIFDLANKKTTRNEGPGHCRTRTDINLRFLTENQINDLLGPIDDGNDDMNLEELDSTQQHSSRRSPHMFSSNSRVTFSQQDYDSRADGGKRSSFQLLNSKHRQASQDIIEKINSHFVAEKRNASMDRFKKLKPINEDSSSDGSPPRGAAWLKDKPNLTQEDIDEFHANLNAPKGRVSANYFHKFVPIVDPKSFSIEQSLLEAQQLFQHADVNWIDFIKQINKKNNYLQNQRNIKSLQKSISGIKKQSSKEIYDRLQKMPQHYTENLRPASRQGRHEKHMLGRSLSKKGQQMQRTEKDNKRNSSMQLQVPSPRSNADQARNTDYSKRMRALTPKILTDCGDLVELSLPLNSASLSAIQYRSKETEAFNPFITFHNQKQTKNKFYLRPTLVQIPDKQAVLELQHTTRVSENMIRYVTTIEFEASLKRGSSMPPNRFKEDIEQSVRLLRQFQEIANDKERLQQLALSPSDSDDDQKPSPARKLEMTAKVPRASGLLDQIAMTKHASASIGGARLKMLATENKADVIEEGQSQEECDTEGGMSRAGNAILNNFGAILVAKRNGEGGPGILTPSNEEGSFSRADLTDQEATKTRQALGRDAPSDFESAMFMTHVNEDGEEHPTKTTTENPNTQRSGGSGPLAKLGLYGIASAITRRVRSKKNIQKDMKRNFNKKMQSAFEQLQKHRKTRSPAGLDGHGSGLFSIFNVPHIKNSYERLKQVKMTEFHEDMDRQGFSDISFDFDKMVFVQTIEYYLLQAIEAFEKRDPDTFTQSMTYIAYMSLIKREFQMSMKIYNLMGHTFKVWRMWYDACNFYKRLRDTARMAADIETCMYAFKQVGFCLQQVNEKYKALKAYKCQLQSAWHINHYAGEMSAYENIATIYFYLGKLEKAEYYLNRRMRGQTEAMFSAQKKISLSFTKRRYMHITQPLPCKADYTKGGAEKEGRGVRELFSKQIKNYNLCDDSVLKDLGFIITKKKESSRKEQTQSPVREGKFLNDATGQYIEPGTPISDLSNRNLPSPSEVKGESHMLLMPFYQEIEQNELVALQEEEEAEARKRKLRKSIAHDEEQGLRKLEAFHRRPCAYNRNEVMVRVYDAAERGEEQPRAGPINIIESQLKEKRRLEMRIQGIREAKRKQRELEQLQLDAMGDEEAQARLRNEGRYVFDMREIRAKAMGASQKSKNNHTLFLSHKNANQNSKLAREIEDSHIELVRNALMELREHMRQERDRIFVTRTAWKRAFKNAQHETKFTDFVEFTYYFAEDLMPAQASQITTSSARRSGQRFDFSAVMSPKSSKV